MGMDQHDAIVCVIEPNGPGTPAALAAVELVKAGFEARRRRESLPGILVDAVAPTGHHVLAVLPDGAYEGRDISDACEDLRDVVITSIAPLARAGVSASQPEWTEEQIAWSFGFPADLADLVVSVVEVDLDAQGSPTPEYAALHRHFPAHAHAPVPVANGRGFAMVTTVEGSLVAEHLDASARVIVTLSRHGMNLPTVFATV